MKVEDFAKLSEPFPADDIEWRVAMAGDKNGKVWARVLAYITSRAVQQRLDDVCGPDGWTTEIIPVHNGAYLCKLSVRVEHKDGSYEWISRMDGSDESNIEAVKGGISGSIKRAAVQFGVGRYLYNLKDNWAIVSEKGKYSGEYKSKDGHKAYFRWDAPQLPAWALPKEKLSPEANRAREEEINKQSARVNAFLNDNVVPTSRIDVAKDAIKNRDLQTLKTIADWCESKVTDAINNEVNEEN